MSVRIHAIAKEVGVQSKELVELLTERGYEIKSASSTIDNITAEALIEELKPEASEELEAPFPPEKQKEEVPQEATEHGVATASEVQAAGMPIVKSKEEVEHERLEKQEGKQPVDDLPPAATAPPPPALTPKPSVDMAPPPPVVGRSDVPATPSSPPSICF